MTSTRKINSNRLNSERSTGPVTSNGKSRSGQNARTHGLFARDPVLSNEDKVEFDALVSELTSELSPTTSLERMAVRDIVLCMCRLNIAFRLESRSAEALLEESSPSDSGGPGNEEKPPGFYALSPQDLRAAIKWFTEVCDDLKRNHVRRPEWKDNFEVLFGPRFYQTITNWNTLPIDAIAMAWMLDAKCKTYHMKMPGDLEDYDKKGFVLDPMQNEDLVQKLMQFQLGHMYDLQRARLEDSGSRAANIHTIELSGRYYSSASRDLHRAIQWFWTLRDNRKGTKPAEKKSTVR